MSKCENCSRLEEEVVSLKYELDAAIEDSHRLAEEIDFAREEVNRLSCENNSLEHERRSGW